jgi:hypothetical protein
MHFCQLILITFKSELSEIEPQMRILLSQAQFQFLFIFLIPEHPALERSGPVVMHGIFLSSSYCCVSPAEISLAG